MAKTKVHYVLVKASFRKPVTGADAIREIRNLSAFSYETHTASIGEDWDEVAFKTRAVARLAGDPRKAVK